MKFEESVFINSPINKVFQFLSNFRSHKKFFKNVQEAKLVSDGKMKEGAELFTKEYFLGRKIETSSKVVTFVPNREIGYQSESGPIPSAIRYLLEENGESTKVTLEYDVDPGSFFRLPENFLRPRIGEELSNSLRNLKQLLEN